MKILQLVSVMLFALVTGMSPYQETPAIQTNVRCLSTPNAH
jgi:hypothetical protein